MKGVILEEPFVDLALLAKDMVGNPKYKTLFNGASDADGDGNIDPSLACENSPCRTVNANNFIPAKSGKNRQLTKQKSL
ncbi:MAG: hypothetical protein LBL45_00895 [Treponema sp.]|nr:hypothetical protein [Treponema sp.]